MLGLTSRICSIPALCCLLWAGPLAAGNGISSGDFLRIPVDSRGSCLSASYVALAQGSAALFHNPAGIARAGLSEFSVSHTELYQDLQLENVSVAFPLGNRNGIGFGATYLGYGDIAGYDMQGRATGDLSAHSMALTIGLSREFSRVISLGVAVKPVFEELGGYSAQTVAYDIGFSASWERFTLAAQYANLGPGLRYISERTDLPRRLRVGLALHDFSRSSTFALAFTSEAGGDLLVVAGSEYSYYESLVFRASYRSVLSGQGSGVGSLGVGVGLRLAPLYLDYSYRPSGELDEVHQITVTFRLGR